ncbi:MAG TPA: porin family protein [Flavobacteriales bacterium]|nr:porin family protein [Flavobacteriales bacterium]HRO40756.1 porin family protein [Flavobacteriales bacterium]HRP82638.1 porin family protein [Flavobacteriales bacterium]HRQ85500.1 porin family protein [Flavobacteriales bacterium]
MKKVSAILCVLALATATAQAQDKSVRFGIKVAPNFGWINPDTKELKNDGARFGYTFGLMGDFMIGANQNYAFATGLFLNNVGGKSTYPSDKQNLITESKYQYIELPLTLKLKTNEIGYMTYYGQIGFGTAFNIRAKSDFDTFNERGEIVRVTDEDIMDNTQLFKASLIVGAGLEFNFSGNTSAMIGVTYNNGFTNINKDFKVGDKELKAKQNYLELSLGVFF